MQPYLSVIIPAYNEEHRLGNTLKEIDKYLRFQDYVSEIIVVSDGSSDKTADVVKKFQKQMPNLKLIDNKENHGKGWVVRQAMLEAEGKYRLFADADNAISMEQIENFWPYLCGTPENEKKNSGSPGNKEGCYEVVVGSIEVAGSKKEEKAGWHRRVLGHFSKLLIRMIALPGIYDSQRAFKLFTSRAVKTIFPKQTIWRWGFDIEILLISRRQGFKIKELPVIWKNLGESKVTLSSYISTFWELLQIRLNDLKGLYG
jgi:dolichyl-phosphate beta-glucosyltransferase